MTKKKYGFYPPDKPSGIAGIAPPPPQEPPPTLPVAWSLGPPRAALPPDATENRRFRLARAENLKPGIVASCLVSKHPFWWIYTNIRFLCMYIYI